MPRTLLQKVISDQVITVKKWHWHNADLRTTATNSLQHQLKMLLIFRICLYREALKESKLAFDYLQLKHFNITNAGTVLSQQ